jgi:hypothetical protein
VLTHDSGNFDIPSILGAGTAILVFSTTALQAVMASKLKEVVLEELFSFILHYINAKEMEIIYLYGYFLYCTPKLFRWWLPTIGNIFDMRDNIKYNAIVATGSSSHKFTKAIIYLSLALIWHLKLKLDDAILDFRLLVKLCSNLPPSKILRVFLVYQANKIQLLNKISLS